MRGSIPPEIHFIYKCDFARRLLQMGVYNCQLYNNLGLCCFYAQQYDMTLSSFERALTLVANDEEQADVWYNIGHVAVVSAPSLIISRQNMTTISGKFISHRHRQIAAKCCFYFVHTGHWGFDAGLSVFQTDFGF